MAQAPTQDFRTARWTEQAVTVSNPAMTGEVALPEKSYLAFFGELDYEIEGLKYASHAASSSGKSTAQQSRTGMPRPRVPACA